MLPRFLVDVFEAADRDRASARSPDVARSTSVLSRLFAAGEQRVRRGDEVPLRGPIVRREALAGRRVPSDAKR
jgi:hypothetical protein